MDGDLAPWFLSFQVEPIENYKDSTRTCEDAKGTSKDSKESCKLFSNINHVGNITPNCFKSCWFVTWILILRSWIPLVDSSRHTLFWLEMGPNYMKHGPSPELGHSKPGFLKLWFLKPKFSKCGPLKVAYLKH